MEDEYKLARRTRTRWPTILKTSRTNWLKWYMRRSTVQSSSPRWGKLRSLNSRVCWRPPSRTWGLFTSLRVESISCGTGIQHSRTTIFVSFQARTR